MSNKKQGEELQSRREFFKKAAKSTLPIFGITILSNIPLVEVSANSISTSGCFFGCSGGCSGTCEGTCTRACSSNCTTNCATNCADGCSGTCYANCILRRIQL